MSFKVRNRFRIRINNVMSVWQMATNLVAILLIPIRHFLWLHFCGQINELSIYI